MSNIRPTQRILDIVNDIKKGFFRLPSIQRSFVWEEERICKLMDSLMNGYPIGSFLVWKPNPSHIIRTRRFVENYKTGERIVSEQETPDLPPYLVLDGQQRFQSLFLSFYGKYDERKLFFKVNSDPSQEESDLRYQFQFLSHEEANQDNHWRAVIELIKITIPRISSFVDDEFNSDSSADKERIIENISKYLQIFAMEEKILIQDVKEDLPYNDVLEVFVRINSGGIVLTKSDLLFSTVILNSPNMENNFTELVDDLNGNGEYDFDIDFIIKTSFELFDKGAKYDGDKLKDGDYIKQLETNFVNIRKALLSTIEFLKTDAKILSKRFLKSDLALVPIIDFIYRQPHQQLPEGQSLALRQYLYMSFFTRFYSFGPDGKIDSIHKKIKEAKSTAVFPADTISSYIAERTGLPYAFSDNMLYDLDLVLNITQGGVAEIPKLRGWSMEQDHIFPKSILSNKGIPIELINNVGNFRYINKTRNIIKSKSMPEENIEFYGSENPILNSLFQEARTNLNQESFTVFADKRKEIIKNKVNEFLGFEKSI